MRHQREGTNYLGRTVISEPFTIAKAQQPADSIFLRLDEAFTLPGTGFPTGSE